MTLLQPECVPWAAGVLPNALATLGIAAALALLIASLWVYGRLLRTTLAGRGKVWDTPLGLPDLVAVAALFAWFGTLVAASWGKAPKLVTPQIILQGSLLFVAVNTAILLFLKARKISIARVFGLRPPRLAAALGAGAGFCALALPLVWAASLLARKLGAEAQPQEIARFFTQAVEARDWGRILLAGSVAAVIAPLTEEFLFRGYIYGTLRRNMGAPAALLLASALFAAIHLNAAVLAPLFLLAVCLTLAYEATGSLWTSVCLHSLFNSLMLGIMAYASMHRL